MKTSTDLLNRKSFPYLILALSGFIFFTAVWTRNIFLFQNFCFHTYDIGLDIEAIKKFAEGNWNGFLSVRQTTYFLDHWEPIMMLISPLSWLIPLPYMLFLVESFFVGLSVYVIWKNEKNPWVSSFLACFIFLNRDIFEAVYFPVHPATWALCPLLLTTYILRDMISQNRSSPSQEVKLVASLLFLNLFNEQFSIVMFCVGMALMIFSGFRRVGLITIVLSVLLAAWAFHWRGMWGPVFPHMHRMPTSWDAWVHLYSWDFAQAKTVFLFFLQFLPLFLFLRRGSLKEWFFWMALFGPLILGRVLSNSTGFHYNPALVAAVLGGAVFFLERGQLRGKVFAFTFVFCLIFVLGKLTKPLHVMNDLSQANCVRITISDTERAQRRADLEVAFRKLGNFKAQRLLVNANLAPNALVTVPEAEIFLLGAYKVVNTDWFDGVVLERGPFGDAFSSSPEKVEEAINILKQAPQVQILEDTPTLFLARGRFDRAPLDHLYFPHPDKWE